MLSKDGYFELTLWNNHIVQVWTSGRLLLLKHPLGCHIGDDSCRERMIKYMQNEGIFDELLNQPIVMLDSYAEESEE